MLNLLDESMEHFLREVVPLPARDVDIAFEAPDGDWSARVSRPTVNLYLWDVRPSMAEREFGMIEVTDGNGQKQRRGPLPRVECRYLVTAWTNDIGDEHSLLGRVLSALLLNPVITTDHLAERPGERRAAADDRAAHRRGSGELRLLVGAGRPAETWPGRRGHGDRRRRGHA